MVYQNKNKDGMSSMVPYSPESMGLILQLENLTAKEYLEHAVKENPKMYIVQMRKDFEIYDLDKDDKVDFAGESSCP